MARKCFRITFRKLNANQTNLETKKITIILQTQQQNLTMNGSRLIKNGIANFYGQSFHLPIDTNHFTISVHQQITPKYSTAICHFFLDKDTIQEFTRRKNIFISESTQVKVTWEAHILDEENSENEQGSQHSNDDFFQLDHPPEQEEQKIRKILSPHIARESKGKRRSFRLRNEETASEPPSDSPYKFTLNTNDTNRRILEKKLTLESLNKIQEGSGDQSSSQRNPIHPVFKQKQKSPKKIRYHKVPLTPQNERKSESRRQTVLNRINLKSVLYTGVFGIISGLTAAQL